MKYLKNYLDLLKIRGNIKLADSINNTAEEIGKKYIQTFSFVDHEVGLLFGNVQSGKTGQMFGVICKAADLGFPVFIILTTDNVVLQQQTLERVKSDLPDFLVCGENDSQLFINNCLTQPPIIVLKKNSRMLKLWANLISSTGFMKGNPLFIVDDEADAASLNTLVNRNRQSSINKYLDTIKNGASSSIYLQVTATPQAILLQTSQSGWHPYFVHYFQPGETYLGGDFFFNNNSNCIEFIDKLDNPMHAVTMYHLAVTAQIILSGGSVSNCLVHPSVRQADHQKFADKVKDELKWCVQHIKNEFKAEFLSCFNSLTPAKSKKEDADTAYNTVCGLLTNDNIKILVMNGKNDVESSEYSNGCSFIVGGNTLGRGVTFPCLQTIYYSRTSKKPQADTMWQHSRMFGYDRDPGMMKVFIDEHLYKLFSDINATNNSIISQVENNISDIKIYYPPDLNPTRKNVLDNKHVEAISGGTNYYPFDPDNDSIDELNELLKVFSNDEPYYQVNLRLIKTILSHIIASDDFKLEAYRSILDAIISDNSTAQGILIVRRNRDVAQGTGALLSPNDWKLGETFKKQPVLTMYQVTGNKGWHGKQMWVPNIKFPDNVVYYNVSD